MNGRERRMEPFLQIASSVGEGQIEYHLIEKHTRRTLVPMVYEQSQYIQALAEARVQAVNGFEVVIYALVRCGCSADQNIGKDRQPSAWWLHERCSKHDLGKRIVFMPTGIATRQDPRFYTENTSAPEKGSNEGK